MKRMLVRAMVGIVILAGAIYAGDYLAIRYRIYAQRNPFEQLTVQPFYTIHEKNGRIEYEIGPPQSDVCIHALFPHLGYAPCWYERRHKEKPVDI